VVCSFACIQAAETRMQWCRNAGYPFYAMDPCTGREEFAIVKRTYIEDFIRQKSLKTTGLLDIDTDDVNARLLDSPPGALPTITNSQYYTSQSHSDYALVRPSCSGPVGPARPGMPRPGQVHDRAVYTFGSVDGHPE
jgi:hypothetical protein